VKAKGSGSAIVKRKSELEEPPYKVADSGEVDIDTVLGQVVALKYAKEIQKKNRLIIVTLLASVR
jgi:hypothetical protein